MFFVRHLHSLFQTGFIPAHNVPLFLLASEEELMAHIEKLKKQTP